MCAWDAIFKKEGTYFTKPHPMMPELVKLFRKKRVKRVLDLGCGSGRHIIYLTKQDFDVYGFDSSPTGLKITENWLKKENITAHLKISDMNKKFPYPDGFFDAVISVGVIQHNTPNRLKRAISEIGRVLKPRGILFIKVPKTKHQAKKYKKTGERTFVPVDGREKGLAHYYFNKKLIKEFFRDFEIKRINIEKGEINPDARNYSFIGIRK